MTPAEAAQKLEALPAATVKLKLVELLEWQASRGKALVNVGWYLRCLFYDEHPRPKAGAVAEANRRRAAALMSGVGR